MATAKKSVKKTGKAIATKRPGTKPLALGKVAMDRVSIGNVSVPFDTKHLGLSLLIVSNADKAGNGIRIVGPLPVPKRMLNALKGL